MIALVPFRTALIVLALAGIDAWSTTARAEDASPWVTDDHSAVRLLAGSRSGNVLLGGVDMTLMNGWKTYWRTPGDSGVPPRFDFSQSDNVESVTTLFPAPMQFPDGAGGTSFGYHKHVVLPLRIVPKDAGKPVTLRMTLNYAVCEKICIPVDSATELAFTSAASAQDGALAGALNSVPKPAQIGDGGSVSVQRVSREDRRVVVDVTAPEGADVNLFAEGPTPDWALPAPKKVKSKPSDKVPAGTLRFAFDLDGLPANTSAEGATIKLTLVGADQAFEYNVTLN
jgi:DsbC/DsbD-like thiol-disulfide interchange protein